MSAARDLTGLVGTTRDDIPERTVGAAPPRRRPPERDTAVSNPRLEQPTGDHNDISTAPTRRPRRPSAGGERANDGRDVVNATRPTTVRISVNLPLACKQWLTSQAREQQRFVSEIVMDALDRFGGEATPPSGRAKRVAVPDGTISNIVLPTVDRKRLDEIVATKTTTRSALLTDVLSRAINA